METTAKKIRKLIKALEIRGEIYLFAKEQIYSSKIDKICTINKLSQLMPIDDYYAKYPKKKRKKNDTREFVKEHVESSFKEIDILLALVGIYKAGGSGG